MKRFHLVRTEDVSGVSGTGVVAEGVEFSDGRIVLDWCPAPSNHDMTHAGLAIYDCMADCIKIHGHDGKTVAAMID